ncbi:MAG: HlyC/CorC family transporter [Candidatus Nitronauta litoralis]|uniref:HlyC/CorC family transporter n=1 Tax=Candidatus Nitronauta litoralis TaxID=2705533 RepID=A0A7T0BYX5_9BACT|nr:MAG: HlyC/CorC family transporter [Candidatus Nitronauta litoralis]
MDLTSTLILVVVFILMEAFFSGCEIGLISINRFKIRQDAEEGNETARRVQNLLSSPERFFSTTSVGTNIAVVSSTAIFTAYAVTLTKDWGDLVAVVILSPVILFLGEIVPKIIFQAKADTLIPLLIHPLTWFTRIFGPVTNIFAGIHTKMLGWLFKSESISRKSLVSRDQLVQVVKPEFENAELDAVEKKMIHRIFNLGDITVEQCMVPLVQMYGISDSATLSEANTIANETGFSRLPVFHERIFNTIGILNTFDLLTAPCDNTRITSLIRPAYYVPPNKKADDLLRELQQRGLHIACVVDEYGGCIGIVTVEDLVEEIVGDIEDEFDQPEEKIETYTEGGYIVEAEMDIEAINEALQLELPEGEYETIGGLIIDRLERIPSPGDQVDLGEIRLTVRESGKRKVNTVIITRIEAHGPSIPAEETESS